MLLLMMMMIMMIMMMITLMIIMDQQNHRHEHNVEIYFEYNGYKHEENDISMGGNKCSYCSYFYRIRNEESRL